MDSKMYIRDVIVILMGFFSSSQGYKFFVGGKDGWVVNPSENYNHWAERNRFQVNDTLFFKYKKESDSVLVVRKDNYYKCNITNPIQSLANGDSEFKFEHSGPFFFIDGNYSSCQKGQKLIIVVMAIRNMPHHPPTRVSPSPEPWSPTSGPPSNNTMDMNPSAPAIAPAQAPKSSSSPAFARPVVLVWCFTIAMSAILGSFV